MHGCNFCPISPKRYSPTSDRSVPFSLCLTLAILHSYVLIVTTLTLQYYPQGNRPLINERIARERHFDVLGKNLEEMISEMTVSLLFPTHIFSSNYFDEREEKRKFSGLESFKLLFVFLHLSHRFLIFFFPFFHRRHSSFVARSNRQRHFKVILFSFSLSALPLLYSGTSDQALSIISQSLRSESLGQSDCCILSTVSANHRTVSWRAVEPIQLCKSDKGQPIPCLLF